ncbi:MAG: prepilin-type N-terminal cleavage/methylation domain-containing protein [Candidatus Omnitrophica bacterium]|nr:prepilin-type N-terminal cleavage/methylation domain-containing protein [Candidatus Omnitrophota bacterium]
MRRRAFSLLEILVALAILTFGLLGLLAILQRALVASEPIEFETRAALLADSILEGLRAHPEGGFPFVPGLNPTYWPILRVSPPDNPYPTQDTFLAAQDGTPYDITKNSVGMQLPFVFSVPGNGVDDDAAVDLGGRWTDEQTLVRVETGPPQVADGPDGFDDQMQTQISSAISQSENVNTPPRATSLRDFDGGAEQGVAYTFLAPGCHINATDEDGDGIPVDTGDYEIALNYQGALQQLFGPRSRPDGDFTYDPQRGIDEELSNGIDDDGDGLTDEDIALASVLFQGGDPTNPYNYRPTFAGDGIDNDGDGEPGSPPAPGEILGDGIDNNGNGLIDEVVADNLDNNNDGRVDEGIDEELFNGRDDDGDGRVDEDCRAAVFPWNPIPFPPPNEEYSFQIQVRRAAIGGDGIDNDGDANEGPRFFTDQSDPPQDHPILYDVNRDGLTNQGDLLWIDEEYYDGVDNDGDGLIDEDLGFYPAPRALLVTILIFQGDDRQDNDGDGWIDEEVLDGIDDDFDGRTDEDNYRRVYKTTGLIQLPENAP